jgi:hypothetical protein
VIASAQRCLNLYPELNTSETYAGLPQLTAAAQVTCYPTPGTVLLGSLAVATEGLATGLGPGAGRGLYMASNGTLYAVVGAGVYMVDPTWRFTLLGVIQPGTKPVDMDDNAVTLVLVDGSSNGYLIDLATNVFSSLIDPTGSFVGSDTVNYIDGFFLFNKPATPQFYSSLAQSVTFDPLYFANKNGAPDNLVAIAVCARSIWLIGVDTTEIWLDAGNADFPFQINPSNFIQHGCAAVYSVAKQDAMVFWLARDPQGQHTVIMTEGYATIPISTNALQNEWSTYPRVDDAIGFCYQQLGHIFYVLTFPAADRTWVYDATTNLWHERGIIDSMGVQHRIRANGFAFAYNKHVVIDFANGSLLAMDPDVYTDIGQPIVRERTFPHLLNELKRLIYRKFVADMETGNTDQVTLYANVSGPVIVESPQLAIAFVDPPSTGTYGVAMTFDGTVFLDGDAVEIAFGTSSTEQPTTGWTAATVTGGTWSGVVTPGE